MTDLAVRIGAKLYVRRTANRSTNHMKVEPPKLGALGLVWRPLKRGPRAFRYAWAQGLDMVVDFQPRPGPITRATQRLPFLVSLAIPGAFIVKYLLPTVRQALWWTASVAVVLPLTIALGAALTMAHWVLFKPAVVALVATGWTPPAATSQAVDYLVDLAAIQPTTPAKTAAPASDPVADLEDLLDPRAREQRLMERQVAAQEEANRVHSSNAKAIERMADANTNRPATPGTQTVVVHQHSGVLTRVSRATGALIAIAALGIGLVLWAGAWILTIGGLVSPDTVPAPPTHEELVEHINATTEERKAVSAERLCDHPDASCLPTTSEGATP